MIASERFQELRKKTVDTTPHCRACPWRYLCGGYCRAWRQGEPIDAPPGDCSPLQKQAQAKLHAALKDRDRDSDVRQAAARMLGEIKDPRAVEPLIAALKDGNSDVRQAAAQALRNIKDPRAVEPLSAALKDWNSDVRQAAAKALRQIRDS